MQRLWRLDLAFAVVAVGLLVFDATRPIGAGLAFLLVGWEANALYDRVRKREP